MFPNTLGHVSTDSQTTSSSDEISCSGPASRSLATWASQRPRVLKLRWTSNQEQGWFRGWSEFLIAGLESHFSDWGSRTVSVSRKLYGPWWRLLLELAGDHRESTHSPLADNIILDVHRRESERSTRRGTERKNKWLSQRSGSFWM